MYSFWMKSGPDGIIVGAISTTADVFARILQHLTKRITSAREFEQKIRDAIQRNERVQQYLLTTGTAAGNGAEA